MGIATIGVGLIDSNLIADGDRATTAEDIIAGGFLFRASIAAILTMYAIVVVLSGALFIVLKSVDRNLALLALLWRLAEAILGGTTVLLSFVVLKILTGEASSAAFREGQRQSLAGLFLDVRTAGLDIVLLFVGLGGTFFCYLFSKSRCIPRALAAWGVFTYVSMFALALVSILVPEHPILLEKVLYGLGGAFEFVVGGWLVVRGVDARRLDTHATSGGT